MHAEGREQLLLGLVTRREAPLHPCLVVFSLLCSSSNFSDWRPDILQRHSGKVFTVVQYHQSAVCVSVCADRLQVKT